MALTNLSQIPLKNLAINGAFDFWQLVEGATSTVNTATQVTSTYAADMFAYQSTGATVKNYSVARSTNVPSQGQSGFVSTYSYLFTMITGIASPAAGDYVVPLSYRMEGLDYERIHAKTVTIGFWVNASVAGTYSLSLGNAGGNRSYVTTFTVSGSNTWQYISLTVPLDSSGGWAFDNTLGLVIYIGVIAGTTFQTSTLNTWQAGAFLTSSTSTNYQATTGATLLVAQLSIAEGIYGYTATGFSRQGASIGHELALCQRYIEVFGQSASVNRPVCMGTVTASNTIAFIPGFSVKKRANPVATVSSATHFSIFNASQNIACTAFADNGCGVDAGQFNMTAVVAALNAGTGLYVNSTSARLYFSATL
jgi:hypothetical protein